MKGRKSKQTRPAGVFKGLGVQVNIEVLEKVYWSGTKSGEKQIAGKQCWM